MKEGADMLMVKPGLPYLDIMREVKDKVSFFHSVYHFFQSSIHPLIQPLIHPSLSGSFLLILISSIHIFLRVYVHLFINFSSLLVNPFVYPSIYSFTDLSFMLFFLNSSSDLSVHSLNPLSSPTGVYFLQVLSLDPKIQL